MLVQQINLISSKSIGSGCRHGELYSHSSDCRLFYQCVHGRLIELRCPNNLYFNPEKNYCDWPKNVECDLKTTATTPLTTINTSTMTPPTTVSTSTVNPTKTPPTPTSTPAPQFCRWEPGQEIAMGNRCDVPHGFFVFQEDGNAVIYDNNNVALWNTQTAGTGHRFVFQLDGNLVMYSSTGTALWNSQTHDQGGILLIFQEDRNLVIYDSDDVALWYSGTHVTTTQAPPTSTSSTTETTPSTTLPTTTPAPELCQWEPGQEIVMGIRCEVPQGHFEFQVDGNAVIYDMNHVPLWHTSTTGSGHSFVFQTDGNLVMYSSTGTAVWNSGTTDQGGSVLIFQEDRNLVMYDSAHVALWYSATTVPTTQAPTTIITETTPSTTLPTTTPAPQICQWEAGQEIAMGSRCDVAQGFFQFQHDGNAVIYDTNIVPLWHTHTDGAGHTFVFQSDGNLVMYSSTGIALWNSQTHDQGGNLLIFQEDRNLVIYNSAMTALWNSRTHVV